MKFTVNNNEVDIPISSYFRARKVKKHIETALSMIDEHEDLYNKLEIEFRYHEEPWLWVVMKYRKRYLEICSINPTHGYYAFAGFDFDEKEFYNQVIRPYVEN